MIFHYLVLQLQKIPKATIETYMFWLSMSLQKNIIFICWYQNLTLFHMRNQKVIHTFKGCQTTNTIL
jgi:hypothetical protein